MDGLNGVIEQVSKEKGISTDSLQETIEQAMVAAARRMYGLTKDIEAQFNPSSNEIELFEFKTVVDEVEDEDSQIEVDEARKLDPGCMVGDELGLKMEVEGLGRIAAQTAKQVIIQRVRDSEREKVYDAFQGRVGELITGIVRRFEKGALIVDLGKTEGVIPSREQVHSEGYRQGDRVQAYILEVARNARGPQVVLSRTHPGMLVKLFELEVPEIYEGIVTIEAAVREPGQRAKIAVSSRDPDVDPVGACVGMKGSRVQAVVAELKGEKIDIISYSTDPARFVCSAISPAVVTKVILDEDGRTMELIVPDDMLSLGIGRRGQNVRLAAQLTGWRIDLHSETQITDMNEKARADLSRINALSEDNREILIRYGFRRLEDIADSEPSDLAETLALEEELAQSIIDEADEILTDELRIKLERREENARRVAAGEPTLEEEEAAAARVVENERRVAAGEPTLEEEEAAALAAAAAEAAALEAAAAEAAALEAAALEAAAAEAEALEAAALEAAAAEAAALEAAALAAAEAAASDEVAEESAADEVAEEPAAETVEADEAAAGEDE
jgi:N utilization substance protein A